MKNSSKIVRTESFQTTDGAVFKDKSEAENHQEAIDARQKVLSELKGAKLDDIHFCDGSGDAMLTFERNGRKFNLSISGDGGDGTTFTSHNLVAMKA